MHRDMVEAKRAIEASDDRLELLVTASLAKQVIDPYYSLRVRNITESYPR